MTTTVDPGREALLADLRAFRKAPGHPSAARLDDLFDLTEALGEGMIERAFAELERYFTELGSDPTTDIGAYFYLSGWGVGGHSIDLRRRMYREAFHCDVSTAWRRAERGMARLAGLIRDRDEHSRPWAVVSVFQTGQSFQAFLDFNLGHESWRPPSVQLNGEELTMDFQVQVADDSDPSRNAPGTRYTSRLVLPETQLFEAATLEEPLGRLRVIWNMPVWPVWQVLGWTTDSQIHVRMRTFRERAVEVRLERIAPSEAASGDARESG